MSKDLILGMKRALKAIESCEGDVDFAVYVIKRDIAEFEKASHSAAPEKEDVEQ